ncbi:LAQU0S06e00408g1_1 [Lachancea quebecensis]|uniref:LAQU0S06e00408g1_1 n=1 Tax=Lachancea quebecensis TaxID=1654605 RepID=A0A0P1KRD6_9SACH|nr:LAQU0S06e00408g1_1 [Lachancea quebecensis]
MPKAQIVLQIDHRKILLGKCGDARPFSMVISKDADVYNRLFLVRALQDLFQYSLMMKPSDTEVLLPENVLLPLDLKQLVSRVLLEILKVSSIMFVPDVLTTCIASGVRNAIVVDIAWEHLVVVPVFDLRILQKQMTVSVKGGKFLHKLAKEARQADLIYQVEEAGLWLKEDLAHLRRRIEKEVIGCESDDTFDIDESPITQMLREVYQNLPLDVRGTLKQRVIVTGWLSNSRGFRNQLKKALFPHFSLIDTMGPWVGGSLYLEHYAELEKFQTNQKLKRCKSVDQVVLDDWHLQSFRSYTRNCC